MAPFRLCRLTIWPLNRPATMRKGSRRSVAAFYACGQRLDPLRGVRQGIGHFLLCLRGAGRAAARRIQLVQQGQGRNQQQAFLANITNSPGNLAHARVQLLCEFLDTGFLPGRAGDGIGPAAQGNIRFRHLFRLFLRVHSVLAEGRANLFDRGAKGLARLVGQGLQFLLTGE